MISCTCWAHKSSELAETVFQFSPSEEAANNPNSLIFPRFILEKLLVRARPIVQVELEMDSDAFVHIFYDVLKPLLPLRCVPRWNLTALQWWGDWETVDVVIRYVFELEDEIEGSYSYMVSEQCARCSGIISDEADRTVSAAAGHDANKLDAINTTFNSIASIVVSKIDSLRLQSNVGTKASTIPTNSATNSTTPFAIEDSNFYLEGMPATALILPSQGLTHQMNTTIDKPRILHLRRFNSGEKGTKDSWRREGEPVYTAIHRCWYKGDDSAACEPNAGQLLKLLSTLELKNMRRSLLPRHLRIFSTDQEGLWVRIQEKGADCSTARGEETGARSSWGKQLQKKKAPRLEVVSEAAISSTQSTVGTAAQAGSGEVFAVA
ncbi:hypothetical protein DFJ73DRAFT_765496 [Zopfochytrium polystomum]|nr:hypothetical protein DFJ73DRAFT_765496 [Zopfochytrium polystomum]